MSGSNPGEPADDHGDSSDTDRDQQPPGDDGSGPDTDRDQQAPDDHSNGSDTDRDQQPPDGHGGGSNTDRDPQSPDGGDWTPPGEAAGDETPPDDTDAVTIEDDGVVRWFLKSDDGNVVFARDILSSVAIVAVIGLILFGLSGVWPPLVAVESGSMEPNMERGDLIFVVDDDRYAGDNPVDGTGIVPAENADASGHEKFGESGDVIVFRPNGDERQTPVIHRAHFWVEEGENWVDTRADEEIIGDATCDDIQSCPANHDGFITKGDANEGYDQHGNGISDVVRPEWVTGKSMFRIPYLGYVRLTFDAILGGMLAPTPDIGSASAAAVGSDATAAQAGVAGVTGVAGASASVAVALGRYRN